MCKHEIIRRLCRYPECDGGQLYCKNHGKLIYRCIECKQSDQTDNMDAYCDCCQENMIDLRLRDITDIIFCGECKRYLKERTEHLIWNSIKYRLPRPSSIDDVYIGGEYCNTGVRRPDVTWVTEDRIVCLEIDEHSHMDRTTMCELAKLDDTKWGIEYGNKVVIIIRYNPDKSDITILKRRDRNNKVISQIKKYLTIDLSELDQLRCNVIYMYYTSSAYVKHIIPTMDSPNINVIDIIENNINYEEEYLK